MNRPITQSSNPGSGYPLETSIFIVGGSVFGLSSAYHLALAGYKNITVFDRTESLPSPHAASHDLNKIIRAEYGVGHATDDFYTELALEAVEAWSSPEWISCFRQTGYVRLARGKATQEAIQKDAEYFSSPRPQVDIEKRWFPSGVFHTLSTPEEIRQKIPQLASASIGGEWEGSLNKHGGFAFASKAITLLHQRCIDLGVKFSLGSDGYIVRLLLQSDERTVAGIEASNGRQHFHTPSTPGLTILAMGAHLPRVLPEARTQVTAKAWSVAHLELTPTEAALLKGSPVVSLSGLGFWIEPVLIKPEVHGFELSDVGKSIPENEKRTYLLKFAAHGGGWTRTLEETLKDLSCSDEGATEKPACSLPPPEPLDTIPASDEKLLRELVQLTLPASLHDRQFVRKSMCWCADTASSDFLIDYAPGYQGLLVGGADSGHAFKFLPTFGKWVADVVESGEQAEERWRWKTDGNCSNVGDSVAWRGASVRDLDGAVMS